jgi:hypothetical protein
MQILSISVIKTTERKAAYDVSNKQNTTKWGEGGQATFR